MSYENKVALDLKFFLMSLGVGVVSLIHFIIYFPISIDDELTATRTDPAVWIAQDRWFAFLVELVFDQPVVPSLYYLFFVFLITVSFWALIKSIGLDFGLWAVTAFGIVVSYPTLFLLISFAGNVLPLGFGLVFSGLALMSFTSVLSDPPHNDTPSSRSRRALGLASSSIFLALSLGAYHSSALLFLVGVFGWVLGNKYSNAKNFAAMSTGLVLFVLGLGLWKLISEIFIFVYKPPLNQLEYIAGYWRPEAFWVNPYESFLSLIEKVFLFYSADTSLFGRSAVFVFFLFLLCVIAIIFRPGESKLSKSISLILLAGSPFLFFFVSGVSGVPIRSHVTVGFVLAVLLLVAMSTRATAVRVGILVLASLSLVQLNQITAEYAAEERLAFDFNMSLASEVYHRMSYCGGEEAGLRLSLIGSRPFSSIYATSPESSSEGSFFGWYGPSPGRAGVFMRLVGYGDVSIVIVDDLQLPAGFAQEMPLFPSVGSMVCVGDVNVLKLSN